MEIRTNLKVETLYFLWFNVSRLIFVTFCIQCFKTTIYFIWFNVSRLFISLTHTKLFAFPFITFTFTPLYTHVHSLSYHPISNTLRKKRCHLASTFQWHLHNSNIAVSFDLTHMTRLWPRKGACVFFFNNRSLRFWCWSQTL